MLPQEDNVLIHPPLYLASTVIHCWKCEARMPVVALIASRASAPDIPVAEETACILSFTEELPEAVLNLVRNRFPSFRYTHSRTTNSSYYANTCPQCGVISGDWHLHEPDGPFFPTAEEDAKKLTIEIIPLGESITVRAQLGMGIADQILKLGVRLNGSS